MTPGPDTEEYLAKRERELRTLGGLSMAALAAVTQLFDAWCQRTLGVAIGTLSLLLLVGLVTSAVRQVLLKLCMPCVRPARPHALLCTPSMKCPRQIRVWC